MTLVFAYGTLRPGCGNDRMLGNYRHLGVATVRGRLHYHECGFYPVLVPVPAGETPSWVTGDLMLVNDSDLRDVLMMEVLAGYQAEWTEVTVNHMTDEALTFPWRRPYYGDRIEGDDWLNTPHGLITPRPKENA